MARLASTTAACVGALSLACSEPRCQDGRIGWARSAASELPQRPGAYGGDWELRLVGRGADLALAGVFRGDVQVGDETFPSIDARDSLVATYGVDGSL